MLSINSWSCHCQHFDDRQVVKGNPLVWGGGGGGGGGGSSGASGPPLQLDLSRLNQVYSYC